MVDREVFETSLSGYEPDALATELTVHGRKVPSGEGGERWLVENQTTLYGWGGTI